MILENLHSYLTCSYYYWTCYVPFCGHPGLRLRALPWDWAFSGTISDEHYRIWIVKNTPQTCKVYLKWILHQALFGVKHPSLGKNNQHCYLTCTYYCWTLPFCADILILENLHCYLTYISYNCWTLNFVQTSWSCMENIHCYLTYILLQCWKMLFCTDILILENLHCYLAYIYNFLSVEHCLFVQTSWSWKIYIAIWLTSPIVEHSLILENLHCYLTYILLQCWTMSFCTDTLILENLHCYLT